MIVFECDLSRANYGCEYFFKKQYFPRNPGKSGFRGLTVFEGKGASYDKKEYNNYYFTTNYARSTFSLRYFFEKESSYGKK